MNRTEEVLLAWAARWHYPALWLTPTEHVRHGERAWLRLACDTKRHELAFARIRQWNRRVQEAS